MDANKNIDFYLVEAFYAHAILKGIFVKREI
jgi:hypothetical protein